MHLFSYFLGNYSVFDEGLFLGIFAVQNETENWFQSLIELNSAEDKEVDVM